MFELVSLFMRYVFSALAALFLLRVILWFRKDAAEYRKDLARLPDARYIGELRDTQSGKVYPIPREADIGKGFSCDIRIRGNGVKRRHGTLRFVAGRGMKVTPVGGQTIRLDGKKVRSGSYALNGSLLSVGSVTLRVCFFIGLDAPHPAKTYAAEGSYDPGNGAGCPEAPAVEWGPVDEGAAGYENEIPENGVFYPDRGYYSDEPDTDTVPDEWGKG